MALKCKNCGSTRVLATQEKIVEITGPFRIYGSRLEEIMSKRPKLRRKPAPEGVVEGRVTMRPSEPKSFREGLFQCECGRKGHIGADFEIYDECVYCGEPVTGVMAICTYSDVILCDKCTDRYTCFHECTKQDCPLKKFFIAQNESQPLKVRRV